jgi:hypothetical protein
MRSRVLIVGRRLPDSMVATRRLRGADLRGQPALREPGELSRRKNDLVDTHR